MKTTMDILEDLKGILLSKWVMDNIKLSGEVRLLKRKLGSTLEDIVLSSVYADAEQVQEARINVNLYVENLRGLASDVPFSIDNTQPNINRVFDISGFLMRFLDDYRGKDFFLEVFGLPEIVSYEGETFLNIQVTYRHLRR